MNIEYISASDLIHDAVDKKTQLGLQAKKYFDEKEFVPDSTVKSILIGPLLEVKKKNKGFVLEGFPRTKGQCRSLQDSGIFLTHFGNSLF
jgi:adenylate kinase